MTDNKGIGNRIKSLRKSKGITQVEFAKSIGITQQALSQIESGATSPSYDALEKLTSIHCISADEILYNKKNARKEDGKKLKYLPLVEQHAVAGFGNSDFSISETDIKEKYLVPKFDRCKIDFMIEVYGDSMTPAFKSGDVVACTIVNEDSFIQWNKVYLLATRQQGLLLKRIRKGDNDNNLLAVSDNPDYDAFNIPKAEITDMALVVGVIRLE